MNNFFKYPSGSDIDVAEMFTKDNLVSIAGVKSGKYGGFRVVLNKDNDFTNIDQPTEKPDFFELQFNGIAISINVPDKKTQITINGNNRINIVFDEDSGTQYDFVLGTRESTEKIGSYILS